jgi:glycosyltransferase involved in cell wall biosynthesis
LNSPLGDIVEFLPLSSTMRSMPAPPLLTRAVDAARRLTTFGRLLRTADVALVFAADGFSVYEKGLMCVMARAAGRGVVLRVGSGLVVRQTEESPLFRAWMRAAFAAANVICALSPKWVDFFESFEEARGKVVVTPNGVELGPPKRVPVARRIVYVGAVLRDKGVFDLVEAMRSVCARHPGAVLTIVGGGDHLDLARDAARAAGLHGSIEFVGWRTRDEVLGALAGSDVFVLPSHFEGLPNAVLEAMASGLPVVATRVGSIPEVVEEGRSGLLVDVRDPRGLAHALIALLDDPATAESMGERGRTIVQSRYSLESAWRAYGAAIFRAAVEAGRLDATAEGLA